MNTKISIRPFLKDLKGVTAVESAFLMPLLLTILLGSVEMGRTFQAWNQGQHALAQAVRVLNIDQTTTASEIQTLMLNYLDDVTTDNLTVNTEVVEISGTEFMKISASFPMNLIIPFWGKSSIDTSVETMAPIVTFVQS